MHASTVLDAVSYNLLIIRLGIGLAYAVPHIVPRIVCLGLQSVGCLQPYPPVEYCKTWTTSGFRHLVHELRIGVHYYPWVRFISSVLMHVVSPPS